MQSQHSRVTIQGMDFLSSGLFNDLALRRRERMERFQGSAPFMDSAEHSCGRGVLIEPLPARACSYAKACLRSSRGPRCP